ncbi:unnamed protein product [Caenorhabditis bovis]|uniref:Band 7 domain-containing protein n=1 Tax=Caenorhabditis bovis TaxID=2654633 RepID=A0A8S1EGH3_9PELO|nr:unnamed protein product [Caenorhabditis bovis]
MKPRETTPGFVGVAGAPSSVKSTTTVPKKDYFHVQANIQNEFGVCGWILTILSYLLIFFTLPISACMCIKVVQEYERAVIFRLGRLMPGGAKGPGIFFIVPCIDTYRKVDLRVLSFEVPPQEILSKDSVTVAVDAVVYFRISNATISVTNVEDAARSTKLLAQTTLRNILGTKTLAEMLSDREAISHQMQTTLDEATEPWGVKVERVEVKDVRLPVQLQRAMAAEAEAAREARAKVIVAEGEQKASRALKEAAEVIAESPSALQLRYLQTLNSISAEKNSTIIFPFPIDLLSAFLQRQPPKVEEPPQLPKKIRSCCLYKYPDWVQGMVGSSDGHGHSHGGGGGLSQGASSQSHSQANFGPNTTTTSGRPLLRSMREAQFHSGAQPPISVPTNQYPTSVNQLDPGTSTIGKRKSSKVGGGNSLLKQAIANRLATDSGQQTALSTSSNQPSTSASVPASDSPDIARIHKTDSNEMTKSVLANPAWYRDEQDRTGFKPTEWENTANKQKHVVKEDKLKMKRTSKDEHSIIKELDSDLLSEANSEVTSDVKSIESTGSDQKLDKKSQKAKEKEMKKKEKEAKKEEKIQKKLKEEEQKNKLKIDKEEKKKKKSISDEIPIQNRSAEVKKPESRIEKAEATIIVSLKSETRKKNNEEQPKANTKPNVEDKAKVTAEPSKKGMRRLEAPHRQNIGERRDSNQSVVSRNSFKSVTFNDQVETREIERNDSVSSSEDDVAIMSDDELSTLNPLRRYRSVQIMKDQKRQKVVNQPEYDYDDELDDFEEQERLALLAAQSGYQPGYDEDDEDDENSDTSQNSYYAEDVEGPDIYLRNEGEFLAMQLAHNQQQQVETGYDQYDQTIMGSMSKLHGDDSSHSLLMGYPLLPRSASGYFEPPPGMMNSSYEQAMRGYMEVSDVPGVHKPASPPRQLRPTITQTSVYENVGDPPSQPQSLILPPSPSIRNQELRQQFFNSTTQTPSNILSKTVAAASSDANSSSGSEVTLRPVEDEMKKKFVARFGARKAPIAPREEDPADPVHVMGSQESMNSTDSRESVISATSIKAEMLARRNFNY